MKHTHVILLALLPFFVACKDDDPVVPSEPENEEELITTVNAYFDLKDSDETTTASWLDLDGPGGNDPVIQGATLLPDTVYTLRLELLNQSQSPAENITLEVEEEGTAHQFFFESNNVVISTSYSDADANNLPIGIQNKVQTGAASEGTFTITLRHEPAKPAEGVSDGDITNAGGETDVEVTLPISIQD